MVHVKASWSGGTYAQAVRRGTIRYGGGYGAVSRGRGKISGVGKVNLSTYKQIGHASEGFKQKLKEQGFNFVDVGGVTYVSKSSIQKISDAGIRRAIREGKAARGTVEALVGKTKATQFYQEIAREEFTEAPRRTTPQGTQVLYGGRWQAEEIAKPEGAEIIKTSVPTKPKLMTMGISFPTSLDEKFITGAKKVATFLKSTFILGKKTSEGIYKESSKIREKILTSKPYEFIEKSIFRKALGVHPKGTKQFITTRERTEEYKKEQKRIEHEATAEKYGIALSSKMWGDVIAKGTEMQIQKGYELEMEDIMGRGKTPQERLRLFETSEEYTRKKWEEKGAGIYKYSSELFPFLIKQKKQISTFEKRYITQQEKAIETFSPSGWKGKGEVQEILAGAVSVPLIPLSIGYSLYHPKEAVKGVVTRPFQAGYQMLGASLVIGGAVKGFGFVKGKIVASKVKPSIEIGKTTQWSTKYGEGQLSVNLQKVLIKSKSGKDFYVTYGEKGGLQHIYKDKGTAYVEFIGKTTKGGKPISEIATAEFYPEIHITAGKSYYGIGTGKTLYSYPQGAIPHKLYYDVAIAGVKKGTLWKTGTIIVGKEKAIGLGLTQKSFSVTLDSTGATKSFWQNVGIGFTKTGKFKLPVTEMVKQAKFTGTFTPSTKMIGDLYKTPAKVSTTYQTYPQPSVSVVPTSLQPRPSLDMFPKPSASVVYSQPSVSISAGSLIKVHKGIIGLEVGKAFSETAMSYTTPVIMSSMFQIKPLTAESLSISPLAAQTHKFGITTIEKPLVSQTMGLGLSTIQAQASGLATPNVPVVPQIEVPEFIPPITPQMTFPITPFPIIPVAPLFPSLKLFKGRKKPFIRAKQPFKYQASLGGVLSGEYSMKIPKGITTGIMPVRWMIGESKKRKVKPRKLKRDYSLKIKIPKIYLSKTKFYLPKPKIKLRKYKKKRKKYAKR